ncbi:MAG: S-layer homology domain-containing protein [Anaerovoracaceae bacterium]|jgi:hypothetical protein
MRKGIAFVLLLTLLLSGFSTVFAAGVTAPVDVQGTIYEEVVITLIDKGVLTGYPDGTYRPGDTISRAEACIIAVKSMKPTDEVLSEASESRFSDLEGFGWAAKYINYAVAKGVINGYPDGTFRPGNAITYNEMATMLVSALGFKSSDLNGVWPNNFVSKAKELGIFSGFTYVGQNNALRGHVALMDYAVVDDIAKANETPSGEPDYADLAGPLAEFSGRAYGMVLDKASVLNEDKDVVEQIEFLFGNKTLYINTNGKFNVDLSQLNDHLNEGGLFGLQMRDGIVQRVGDSNTTFAAIGTPAGFEDFTDHSWKKVTGIKNAVVTFEIDGATSVRSILDDASIYVATYDNDGNIDGYKPGTLRDIKSGHYVRLYSVTGNEPGVVEIVVVRKQ